MLIQLLPEIKIVSILTIGQLPSFDGLGIMIKRGKVGGKNNMAINQSVTTAAKLNISSRILKSAEIGWTN